MSSPAGKYHFHLNIPERTALPQTPDDGRQIPSSSTVKRTHRASSSIHSLSSSSRSRRTDRSKISPTPRPRLNELSPLFSQGVKDLRAYMDGGKIIEEIVAKRLSYESIPAQLLKTVKVKDNEKFRELILSENPEKRSQLIQDLLIRTAFSMKDESYDFIIKNLRTLYPQLDRLILPIETSDFMGYSLSDEGIKIIIEHLVRKGSLKMDCRVCDSFSDLETEINEFINSGLTKIGFIVRNQAKPSENVLHVSPIYIEKHGDSYRCAISDSLGKDRQHGVFASMKLKEILKKQVRPFEIYCYNNESRQYKDDRTNCPVFCILDIVQYSKYPAVMDFIIERSKRASEKSRIDNILFFDNLPYPMMKTTQSISKLRQYDQTNDESIYETIKEEGHIQPLSPIDDSREINVLIEQHFLKYQRLLISRVITDALSSAHPQS